MTATNINTTASAPASVPVVIAAPETALDRLLAKATAEKAAKNNENLIKKAAMIAERARLDRLAEEEAEEAALVQAEADALDLNPEYAGLYQASKDRVYQTTVASLAAKGKAESQSFLIEAIQENFETAAEFLEEYDMAIKTQQDNLVKKQELDYLSNLMVQQMRDRGLSK